MGRLKTFKAIMVTVVVTTAAFTSVGAKSIPTATVGTDISQSDLTPMNMKIVDYDDGFTFTIPYKVVDGIYANSTVSTESKHIKGYTFNLKDPKSAKQYVISLTKRDNLPQDGSSQTQWNTTWYNKPIEHLSKEDYLETWREHAEDLQNYDLDGDVFDFPGATAARWSRVTPKTNMISDSNSDTSRAFTRNDIPNDMVEVEFIMQKEPKYRYTMLLQYPSTDRNYMYQALQSMIPSFGLIANKDIPKGKVKLTDEVGINLPKGFSITEQTGDSLSAKKDDMQLDVGTFAITSTSLSVQNAYPTISGRLKMAEAYKNSLEENYGGHISDYEGRVINQNVGYVYKGTLESAPDIGKANFAAYLTMTDTGKVVIARLMSPKENRLNINLEDLIGTIQLNNKPLTIQGVSIL